MSTTQYEGLRLAAERGRQSTESLRLRQYRQAAQGDESAKRQIEARELLRAAGDATSKLRDKAAQGDTQAMAALKAIAEGKAPAQASAPSPAGLSAIDVGLAVSAAVRKERDRVAAVFGSEHSRGRERGCAALLSSDKGWTAEQIVAELPNLPTDRDLAANDPATRARSDAAWEKAHAALGDGKQRATTRSQTNEGAEADKRDPWARVYANIGRAK